MLDNIKYRSAKRTTKLQEKNGVYFLTYDLLEKAGVRHAVSTRLGGVSEGCLGEMNLSYTRGDAPDRVRENHRLFAEAVGYSGQRLVLSDQVHETTIYCVREREAGAEVVGERVDGLMTDVPDLPLMTFYADCVPLLFYDVKNHVIGMAHSGWRGTAARIGEVMLRRMGEEYGTLPKDVLTAIGPSICQECYEVDHAVAEDFYAVFGQAAQAWLRGSGRKEHYLLDLASACRYTLMEAGVAKEHIAMPDLCTCCNPWLLFSHRASGGKRGNLGAVMVLDDRDSQGGNPLCSTGRKQG